ncbi:hypothetical protein L3Q82_023660, partial [Scortum barcoo]
FTASHHTEDTMNSPIEPDNDEWKLNQKVIWDAENEEINTYTDTSFPPAPTDVEEIFTLNNEDETQADEHMESERRLAFEATTVEVSLNEEEIKKNSEYEAEREKQHCEEMEREERKRQIERDFQEELKKIMEAEKLHQKELELMERRAQEKLEQELQLQQELISNLRRRVEEERRVREEEQKRIKDEEDKRKREEEKIKVEAERRRMEEETRRKEEEERRIQEVKRKKEEERKKEEQEKRRMEREEKRKREEERKKSDLEKKKLEEEMRMMEEEEERKNGEKMERMMMEEERKREEERRKEEAKKKIGKERRKTEEEMNMRKVEESRKKDEEEERKREEEKIKAESEMKRMEEEMRRKKEEERRIEEMKLIKEEEKKKEEQEKRRMEREEKRKREEERKKLDLEKKKLEEEMRMMKEEEEQKNREKMEGMMMEEERKREEERRKEEAKKKTEKRTVEEDVSMRKEEKYQTKEDREERKKREEKNTRIEGKLKETDKRKKQDEIIKNKEEEEDSNKIYEEMRKSYKREHGHVDEEVKLEENTMVKEAVRKGEGENSKKKEELRPIEEDERRKEDDEWITKEGERRRQKEEIRRQHDESKIIDKEKKQEEEEEEKKQVKEEMRVKEEERKNAEGEKEQNKDEMRGNKKEVNQKTGKEIRVEAKEEGKMRRVEESEKKIRAGKANELQEKTENRVKKSLDKTEKTEDGTAWTSSGLGPLHSESTVDPGSSETTQQLDPDKDIGQISADKTAGCENQAAVPACLPEHTEQRRLSWMKDCIPWSKLSLQNRRKQKRSVKSRGGRRRVSEAGSLPPLYPNSLLESKGRKSLQEVTTVTLEDLPGCSLSTLTQCAHLQSLTLRRCGLKSLEDINKLAQLCYIDVQENDISFIDCENMTSLRVLRLARNKLTSIHGLSGAENLDVLDLSHNSITRIAGLESVRRLQRLSLDHNQLISTKGLKDVYTLLYLNCSHNHLVSVEGLENNALLNTLDLRANSLTEPPRLKNQVLLRELHLDDNSISSLLDLTACWLPLLQHLSVAQNRITQLPSMSDSVSLANLDLRFNCISELQNVCESLEGCQFLQEVHLTGNPLQQESGWRSTLQRAVPGLRAIDGQETDSFASPPAVQQVSSASGSFLTFCQAQLQQTCDLQQRHSRELSNASSSLDAVETSCRHFTEALQLAEDQRFAHEYGDTSVADKHGAAGQTAAEETLDLKVTDIGRCTERPEMESNGKAPPVIPKRDNMRCSAWTFEEKSAADSRHDTFDTVTDSKMEPAIKKIDSGSVHSLAKEGKPISSNLNIASVSNHQNLDVKNTAAVVIQQLWRKYRQKCGNISSPSTAEKGGGRGGDGEKPESGPSCINGSQDYAAAVIQAFWRGFALRRRLASALAAVTCLDTGEDDTFEEVDVDEFVFDEPPERSPEPSQYTVPSPLVGRSKQAWVAGEPVASAGQRVSPVSSNSKSPASPLVVSGLSERSEKILEEWGFTHSHTALLMLKRAQNMKSKKHQQRKRRDPSVRLALFRNCSYQPGPVEKHNRKAQNNRNDIKAVPEAELGLQQAERTERARQERAQQHTQAAQPDRDSESLRFLPEISSDILNGGRVQLVADPGYTERPHHASGLWANSRLAAQPRKENNYPRRNSLGHARKEAPSPKRITSAPSKTERISFRDNPVQLSAGWGGGKKRDKVYK